VFLTMFAIPTFPHRLLTNCPPRSTRYVFLEYSVDHKGYQCLDLSTNNIVIFRHVVFDEAVFPFAVSPCLTNDLDIFLQDDASGAAPIPAPLSAPRVPKGSRHWPLLAVRPENRGWLSDRDPGQSDRPGNKGWRSDCHPRRSDHPPPRRPIIDGIAEIHRASCGLGIRDSTHASRGSDIPALLTSPSGCAGATGTASTSAVAASEGRTDGTSSQPSSDDHAGEAELPATGRQTHLVGHLIVVALSGAHLRPRRPCRPVLASCHGGRICYFDHQQYLGSCPSSC
jgi:hypothetical protein